ncbi:13809_t:CDS:2 [Funneliformis caledonium]|uniref:13809_t:CDS:1 n=1 Tax=Funneliformis caledonium TaxID=1117310 RepID=A0A9N9HA44_9GLOM|nr:13809_t:CDS:2 [Funneliformis caledonium]
MKKLIEVMMKIINRWRRGVDMTTNDEGYEFEVGGGNNNNALERQSIIMEFLNHMEAVEVQLKEFHSILSDEVIKDIRKSFKELIELPKIFENYQNIVNYDISLRKVVDRLIDERLINKLKLLANQIAYLKRIEMIRDVLNSPNKEDILFNNALSEEEINKRYRNLVLNFHPDKTNRTNSPCSLQGEHKKLGAELFGYIIEIKEGLLTNYKKILSNEGWMFHKKNADQLWKITIDYRNAAKGQLDKLKTLKKDDISGLTSKDLEDNSVTYGLLAYREYRDACKIVDKAKQLKEQVRLRGCIALCLYVSKKLLEAQLYALAAIRLQLKNSHEVTLNDLNEAQKIFDKVRGRNTADETPELQTVINLKVDSNDSRALVKIVDQGISFSDKISYQRSIDDDMRKIGRGIGIMTTGVGVGVAVTAAASVWINTAILLGISTVGGPIWLAIGLLTFVPGILEKLNCIMKRALKSYDEGDHQQFITILSEEYKTNTSLIKLRDRSDFIDTKKIVETLLDYGFRSDGIAYLLILLGDVLSSGKIKIEGITTKELISQAKHVLTEVRFEILDEMAKKLDDRIDDALRTKDNLFSVVLNKVTDFIFIKDYSNIDKEHKGDAQETSFQSRLEEMRNVAEINLAIFDIIDGGDEELERARKAIEKIRDQIYRYGFAVLRLEVLEDFLFVLHGLELLKITFPVESGIQSH